MLANRQYPDASFRRLDRKQCARLETVRMLFQGASDEVADGFRRSVLGPHLDDAGTNGARVREQGSEIEVVGEDDEVVLQRVGEDCRVRCVNGADLASMDRIDSGVLQPANPARSQVHVDEQFHDAVRGSSCSSERQAAYARAARMSSSSK